jgi:DNA-binding NarL/FixJ family response regulator
MNPSTKRRHASTARTAGRDASSTRAPKARIRVLIADDHGAVREGLVSMIQRNKVDMTVVGEASSGREAVELWKEHRPDVTLLDLRMPELDGVDAIKEIRGNDEKPGSSFSQHSMVTKTFTALYRPARKAIC